MNTIIKILMNRDGLSVEEAKDILSDLQYRFIMNNEEPEELLMEIGLEPDYVFGLLPF